MKLRELLHHSGAAVMTAWPPSTWVSTGTGTFPRPAEGKLVRVEWAPNGRSLRLVKLFDGREHTALLQVDLPRTVLPTIFTALNGHLPIGVSEAGELDLPSLEGATLRDKREAKRRARKLPVSPPTALSRAEEQLQGQEAMQIGPGQGEACSLCDEVIDGDQEQVTLVYRELTTPVVARLHADCSAFWWEPSH